MGVADYRSDADAGGSPEHVFDTMVMELDQRLEKVRGGEEGAATVKETAVWEGWLVRHCITCAD